MIARRHLLGLCLAPVVFAAGPLAAVVSCSAPPVEQMGPCQNGTIQLLDCEPDDAGVVAETFTDEACDSLDTAESRMLLTHDDAMAPAVDAPTEAQAVPSSTPFTFTWHPQGISRRATPTQRAFAWRDDVTRWTTLLPAADAHCTAFGGVAYAVVFRDASGHEVLRAETAHTSYTPTAAAWSTLRAVSGAITLTVEVARYADNNVTQGPVDQATARHFTLGP